MRPSQSKTKSMIGPGIQEACKRAELAPARCWLLPPQPRDDQNRRLARVVEQLGQAVGSYTLRKYGAGWGDLAQRDQPPRDVPGLTTNKMNSVNTSPST